MLRLTFFDFDADPETWAFSDEVGAQAHLCSEMHSIITCEESHRGFTLSHGGMEVTSWCKCPQACSACPGMQRTHDIPSMLFMAC